jgi:hypothetical protein
MLKQVRNELLALRVTELGRRPFGRAIPALPCCCCCSSSCGQLED